VQFPRLADRHHTDSRADQRQRGGIEPLAVTDRHPPDMIERVWQQGDGQQQGEQDGAAFGHGAALGGAADNGKLNIGQRDGSASDHRPHGKSIARTD
jgi:hypothetical protein